VGGGGGGGEYGEVPEESDMAYSVTSPSLLVLPQSDAHQSSWFYVPM